MYLASMLHNEYVAKKAATTLNYVISLAVIHLTTLWYQHCLLRNGGTLPLVSSSGRSPRL